jgi:hypothetical protein
MYQDIGRGLKVLELVIGNSITGRKRPIPEYLEAQKQRRLRQWQLKNALSTKKEKLLADAKRQPQGAGENTNFNIC